MGIYQAEIDAVHETQMNFIYLLDNELDHSDDAYWVEVAWRREILCLSIRMAFGNGGTTMEWSLSRYVEK